MVCRLIPAALAKSAAAMPRCRRIPATLLPVSGVSVEAREQRTGALHRTTTPESGEYHFSALTPGLYQLAATRQGFQITRRSGVELRVSSRAAIDLALQIGAQTESVEVTASAPLLESNTGTVS